MFLEVADHLAEHWPLGDGLARVAGLDELLVNDGADGERTPLHEIALGGYRVAVRIDIDRGIHLPDRRHTQVQHRPLRVRLISGDGVTHAVTS